MHFIDFGQQGNVPVAVAGGEAAAAIWRGAPSQFPVLRYQPSKLYSAESCQLGQIQPHQTSFPAPQPRALPLDQHALHRLVEVVPVS